MKRFCLFAALFCACFSPFSSLAASKTPMTRERPSIMRSVAALGMGNAYYALSNNKYASFYNPAGLKYVKRRTVDIIPISIGVNDTIINQGKKAWDIYNHNSNNLDDPRVISDLLDIFMGRYVNIAPLSFFPAYTGKNFSFGIFSSNEVNILAYNRVLPEAAFRAKSDNGAAVSWAAQFLSGDALSVGVTLKGLYRVSFTKAYNAVEIAGLFADGSQSMKDLEKEIRHEGMGWGVLASVGAIYELPFLQFLSPRVGVSFNDFGYTDFGHLMESIDPTLNVALAVAPRFSFISTDLEIDLEDVIMNAGEDKSFLKRLDVGLQIGFWDRMFLRAGLHQGYPTLGAGVDVRFVRIDYAYYSEELGAYPGQRRDERHAVELALGF